MCVSCVRHCQIPSVGTEPPKLNVNNVQKWGLRHSTPSIHTWWPESLPIFYAEDRLRQTSHRNTQALGVVKGTMEHHRLYFAWNNSLRGNPVHLRLSRSSEWCVFCLCVLWLIRHFAIFSFWVWFGRQKVARPESYCCCSVTRHIWLFITPWTAAHQPSLSSTVSWSLLKLVSTESVMAYNHLILFFPLFLLPSIFSSIRSFPMS